MIGCKKQKSLARSQDGLSGLKGIRKVQVDHLLQKLLQWLWTIKTLLHTSFRANFDLKKKKNLLQLLLDKVDMREFV